MFRPERDARAMAAVIEEWLGNPMALARATRELCKLRDEIVKVGATARTADRILAYLSPLNSAQSFARAA